MSLFVPGLEKISTTPVFLKKNQVLSPIIPATATSSTLVSSAAKREGSIFKTLAKPNGAQTKQSHNIIKEHGKTEQVPSSNKH